MSLAAIKATFSDFRIVKGRKVCQFVFETPLEAADDALHTLGGLPQPMSEKWVGIALLDMKAASDAEKPRRKLSELPIAQRAALMGDRQAFWLFLYQKYAYPCYNNSDAAAALREMCGVKSRSELSLNVVAATNFERIEREFECWLTEPV